MDQDINIPVMILNEPQPRRRNRSLFSPSGYAFELLALTIFREVTHSDSDEQIRGYNEVGVIDSLHKSYSCTYSRMIRYSVV